MTDPRWPNWATIASEAHANQLLRREMKQHLAWAQKRLAVGNPEMAANPYIWSRLLAIRPGVQYQFYRSTNYHTGRPQRYAVLFLRRVPAKTDAPKK